MSTITREWLQQAINDYESVRDELPFGLDDYQGNILAALRIALASLEAEAIAVRARWKDEGYGHGDWKYYNIAHRDALMADETRECELIYTAPPVPVSVPVALNRLRSIVADPRSLPRRKEWISGQQYSYVLLENVEGLVEEACRAAMLQGAEPSTDNTNQQFESLSRGDK